jgi:hypothetical protein
MIAKKRPSNASSKWTLQLLGIRHSLHGLLQNFGNIFTYNVLKFNETHFIMLWMISMFGAWVSFCTYPFCKCLVDPKLCNILILNTQTKINVELHWRYQSQRSCKRCEVNAYFIYKVDDSVCLFLVCGFLSMNQKHKKTIKISFYSRTCPN